MSKHIIQNSAIIAVAVGAAITAIYLNTNWLSPQANVQERERCYGIVKAGKNDCGSTKHSCANQAPTDNSVDEFIMLPKGLCERITGGRIE